MKARMTIEERINSLSVQQKKRLGELIKAKGLNQPIPNRSLLKAFIRTNGDKEIDPGSLREHIAKQLPRHMIPHRIEIVDSYPLSPNGKIDRKALASTSGPSSTEPDYTSSSGDVFETLSSIWTKVLGLVAIKPDQPFFDLGGDSISAIQIVSAARKKDVDISVADILRNPTIAELAQSLKTPEKREKRTKAPLENLNCDPKKAVPFTQIQNWFFSQELFNPNHWNQSLLIQLPKETNYENVRSAISCLYQRHEALRIQIIDTPTGKRQYIAEFNPRSIPCERHFSASQEGENLTYLADGLHESLSFTEGQLLKTAFIESESSTPQLVIVAHHLCVDIISWNILVNELESFLTEPDSARAYSFSTWAHSLEAYANTEEISTDANFWLNQAYEQCSPIPLDYGSLSENIEKHRSFHSRRLSREQTLRLEQRFNTPNRNIRTVLLAAIAQTLKSWCNDTHVLIGLEGHGREDLGADPQTDELVGWLTSYYPMVFDLSYSSSETETINDVSRQIETTQKNGFSFGLLQYGKGALDFQKVPEPEVTFNYIGKTTKTGENDKSFKVLKREIGKDRHPENRRVNVFEIDAAIVEGELEIKWVYADSIHKSDTILYLLNGVEEILATLADTPWYSESNYPLSPTQENLLIHRQSNRDKDLGKLSIRGVIEGHVTKESLNKSWEQVQLHYPSLRAEIVRDDMGAPMLNLSQEPKCGIQFLEDTTSTENRNSGSTSEFNQLSVTKLDTNSAHFEWNCHHLFLDGWSGSLILQKWLEFLEGKQSSETERGEQTRAFNDYYRSLDLISPWESAVYWKDYLATTSPCLVAKPISGRGVARSEVSLDITEVSEDSLRRGAKRFSSTPSSLAIAAWAITLSSLLGRSSVCFGLIHTGRNMQLDHISVLAANLSTVVPLGVDLNGKQNLDQLLKRLFKDIEISSQHAHFPQHTIARWVCPETKSELFDTTFNATSFPDDLATSHYRISKYQGGATNSAALAISIVLEGSLTIVADYDPTRISASLVQFITKRYSEVLSQLQNLGPGEDSKLAELAEPLTAKVEFLAESTQSKIGERKVAEVKRTGDDAPRTFFESQLTELWRRLFEKQDIGIDDNFFDLGGSSFLAAQTVAEIQTLRGTQLSIAQLFKTPTIRLIARVVEEKKLHKGWRSLVTLQKDGEENPLYCIHGYTGEVFGFMPLAKRLAPSRPVYGLQAIGLDGSEKKQTNLEEMAKLYAQEIMGFQKEGPYHLLGHSLGGWYAYAVANEIQHRGGKVGSLSLLDTHASCRIPNPYHTLYRLVGLFRRVKIHLRAIVKGNQGSRLKYIYSRIGWLWYHLGFSKNEAKLMEKMEEGSTKGEDFFYFAKVVSRYRPTPYLGDADLFSCQESRFFDRVFWRSLIRGKLSVYRVQGDHMNLIEEENIEGFSSTFKKVIAENDA